MSLSLSPIMNDLDGSIPWRMTACIPMPISGFLQEQPSSGVWGQKNIPSMRPPPASTVLRSLSCILPRISSSSFPRPMPDWLVITMTRNPASLSLLTAPGTSSKTTNLSGSSQYGTSFATVSSRSMNTAYCPNSSLSTMPQIMWFAQR